MKITAPGAAIGVLLSLSVLASACGHSKSDAVAGPCGTTVAAGGTTAPDPIGATAALLSARIVVSPGASSHRCLPLQIGATVHLFPGDRVEFLANGSPMLSPQSGKSVRVTTTPAVLGPGPASSHDTLGLLVRITAVSPGTVTARWTNCSGTAC